ncbi:restriction endonuclease subunit S [Nitrosomonas oligotropha]|uniref:restriction endonuclease subunit S n=1 Tax=Nitrosomonas oligotropha TaxID=42354 RepID=UPI001371B1DC|nr:restriction endonuclease subunit S [Nitrosomonas oligotropha]
MSLFRLLKISDFCKTGSGGTPARQIANYYENGDIPWVKSGELRENIIFDTEEKITEEALQKSSAKIVPKGSLLLAMYGATVGRLAFLGIDAATNQAICNIQPDENICFPKYLYYALLQKVPEFLNMATGGAQPNISQSLIRETEILLPSLEEQKRIAAILDKADAIRRKRQQVIALTDQFLRSVFLDLFGDPVTNPKGWKTIPLDEIADIHSGITKGRKIREQVLTEIPYMRVANVQDGYIQLDDVATIAISDEEKERYLLMKHDILLTEGGDPDKLGRGAVWQAQIDPCIHQNHIFRVRIRNDEEFMPHYLSTLIGSQYGKRYFLIAAKQTTGIATINKTQLKEFPVLVPSIQLQKKFSNIVEKIEFQSQKITGNRLMMEKLFVSLTQRAFRGELNRVE